jgi:hypothetical protein
MVLELAIILQITIFMEEKTMQARMVLIFRLVHGLDLEFIRPLVGKLELKVKIVSGIMHVMVIHIHGVSTIRMMDLLIEKFFMKVIHQLARVVKL